jgi:hypothetical protein
MKLGIIPKEEYGLMSRNTQKISDFGFSISDLKAKAKQRQR